MHLLEATTVFSWQNEVGVEDIVPAFRGGWLSPTLIKPEDERVSPLGKEAVPFATQMVDLLEGLRKAKKIEVLPTLKFQVAEAAARIPTPWGTDVDDPRILPRPVDKFLRTCDEERLAAAIEPCDLSWTPGMLTRVRVRVLHETRMPVLTAAKLSARIDSDALYLIVEALGQDHRRRKGVDLPTIQGAIGISDEEHALFDALIEEAVHTSELSRVEDDGPARYKEGWQDTRRGVARALHAWRWTQRRSLKDKPRTFRRVDLSRALELRKGEVTEQIDTLLAYGLVRETDQGLSVEHALRDMLQVIHDHLGGEQLSVRKLVRHLQKTLRPSATRPKAARPTRRTRPPKVPSELEEDTVWALLDDLVPRWLEEPAVELVGGPQGSDTSTYRMPSRPHQRVPYDRQLRLTADALVLLQRCAVCREPWTGTELISTALPAPYETHLSAPVHASCARAPARLSWLLRGVYRPGCADCAEPIEVIEPGPIFLRDLREPEISAYILGWERVTARYDALISGALASDSHQARKAAEALQLELDALQRIDLRGREGPRRLASACIAMTRKLADNPLSASLGHRSSHARLTSVHETELRNAVSIADEARPRVVRLRNTSAGLAHADCPSPVTR